MRSTIDRLLLSSLLLAATSCTMTSCLSSPRVWVESEQEGLVGAEHGIRSLRVTTHNGRITTSAEDGRADVSWHARVRAGGWTEEDAQRALAAVQLSVETSPIDNALELGWRWNEDPLSTWGCSVDFTVDVPADTSLKLSSRNGNVRVAGPLGPTELTTRNGGIDVRGSLPGLHCETRNGSIHLGLAPESGPVAVETRNGRVTVEGGMRSLVARARNGSITADLSRQPVSASMTTRNGSVKLALPSDADATLEAATRNGKIRIEAPVHDIEKGDGHFRGRLGSGERAHVEIETRNGSIAIEANERRGV